MSDIKVIRKANVEVAKLHVRWIPVVTPLNIWNNDMSLPNSPHVELMELFKEYGFDWDRIKMTRYFAERKHRFEIGMHRWTKAYIKAHCMKRYKVFKSMKKGFDKAKCKGDPVKVLESPFWYSRFDRYHTQNIPDGYFVWNGMGRSSAAFVLGIKKIPVVICEDAKPGSGDRGKFSKKLKGIEGVWE